MEFNSVIEEQNLTMYGKADGTGHHKLNELSQTQNDRQEFCDFFHVWEIGSGRT